METNDLEKIYRDKEAYLKRGFELKEKVLQQEIEILKLQQELQNKEYRPIQSESTDKVDAAMAKAWGELPCLEKDAVGMRSNATYAVLDGIIKAIKPILKAHKLYVKWEESPDGILTTQIRHESGQWIGSRKQLITWGEFPSNVNLDHACGGHLTYQKRYQLVALIGSHPGGDDDDQGIMGKRR